MNFYTAAFVQSNEVFDKVNGLTVRYFTSTGTMIEFPSTYMATTAAWTVFEGKGRAVAIN
jgi:hypothetical protein